MIHYTTLDTPIGTLALVQSPQGLRRILFKEDIPRLDNLVHREYPSDPLIEEPDSLREAVQQLQEYFLGKRTHFTLQLDLEVPPFYRKVLLEVARIPYGKVASYKEIALWTGNPGAVRAVGSANAHNPLPIVIPCHRVLTHNRSLGGYGGGQDRKHYLLKLEGAL